MKCQYTTLTPSILRSGKLDHTFLIPAGRECKKVRHCPRGASDGREVMVGVPLMHPCVLYIHRVAVFFIT